ncbi:pro-FMRFamide-related neuropeptide VF [Sarcophilus harrisii]
MEIISLKSFVGLTLATSALLASRSVCADESVISNLRDREHYDEYLKVCSDIRRLAAPAGTVVASLASLIGHPKEKKQRDVNSEELQQWGSNTIPKVQNPKMYKMSWVMPLRYGSFLEEDRSVEPVANLPLRLGWNFDGGISRRIPNLPQRFGRAAVKSIMGSMVHLPQRLLKSPSSEYPSYPIGIQPQELQAADEGKPRTLDFDDYFTKKTNEVSQE